jgi:hypothetical protein
MTLPPWYRRSEPEREAPRLYIEEIVPPESYWREREAEERTKREAEERNSRRGVETINLYNEEN